MNKIRSQAWAAEQALARGNKDGKMNSSAATWEKEKDLFTENINLVLYAKLWDDNQPLVLWCVALRGNSEPGGGQNGCNRNDPTFIVHNQNRLRTEK